MMYNINSRNAAHFCAWNLIPNSTLTKERNSIMNEDDVIDIIGYLTRSKAIWRNPELLNLVESAPSPTKAQALVLQKTGKKKKGVAAYYYASAIRDFGKESLGALTVILSSPQGEEKLEEWLTTTSHAIVRRDK